KLSEKNGKPAGENVKQVEAAQPDEASEPMEVEKPVQNTTPVTIQNELMDIDPAEEDFVIVNSGGQDDKLAQEKAMETKKNGKVASAGAPQPSTNDVDSIILGAVSQLKGNYPGTLRLLVNLADNE